jgi:SHS2 domain-containing protein
MRQRRHDDRVDTARGHRTLPHTADVILEAWGPDLAACFEEAVMALAEVCVESVAVATVGHHKFRLPAAPDDELLVALAGEVIFLLDTADAVPVAARVRRRDDGGLDVTLVMGARDAVEATGAVPKAVSRSELAVVHDVAGVRCRFLVDV